MFLPLNFYSENKLYAASNTFEKIEQHLDLFVQCGQYHFQLSVSVPIYDFILLLFHVYKYVKFVHYSIELRGNVAALFHGILGILIENASLEYISIV